MIYLLLPRISTTSNPHKSTVLHRNAVSTGTNIDPLTIYPYSLAGRSGGPPTNQRPIIIRVIRARGSNTAISPVCPVFHLPTTAKLKQPERSRAAITFSRVQNALCDDRGSFRIIPWRHWINYRRSIAIVQIKITSCAICAYPCAGFVEIYV